MVGEAGQVGVGLDSWGPCGSLCRSPGASVRL